MYNVVTIIIRFLYTSSRCRNIGAFVVLFNYGVAEGRILRNTLIYTFIYHIILRTPLPCTCGTKLNSDVYTRVHIKHRQSSVLNNILKIIIIKVNKLTFSVVQNHNILFRRNTRRSIAIHIYTYNIIWMYGMSGMSKRYITKYSV